MTGLVRLNPVVRHEKTSATCGALAAGFDRHLKMPVWPEDIEHAIGEMEHVR